MPDTQNPSRLRSNNSPSNDAESSGTTADLQAHAPVPPDALPPAAESDSGDGQCGPGDFEDVRTGAPAGNIPDSETPAD